VLGGAEKPVCRHQAVERLVWALEVVTIDEERQSPLAISEVAEDRPRQKLVP
jgi:hypothetical protein